MPRHRLPMHRVTELIHPDAETCCGYHQPRSATLVPTEASAFSSRSRSQQKRKRRDWRPHRLQPSATSSCTSPVSPKTLTLVHAKKISTQAGRSDALTGQVRRRCHHSSAEIVERPCNAPARSRPDSPPPCGCGPAMRQASCILRRGIRPTSVVTDPEPDLAATCSRAEPLCGWLLRPATGTVLALVGTI